MPRLCVGSAQKSMLGYFSIFGVITFQTVAIYFICFMETFEVTAPSLSTNCWHNVLNFKSFLQPQHILWETSTCQKLPLHLPSITFEQCFILSMTLKNSISFISFPLIIFEINPFCQPPFVFYEICHSPHCEHITSMCQRWIQALGSPG